MRFTNRTLPVDAAHLTPSDGILPWNLQASADASASILRFPSPVATPYECNNTVWCDYMVPAGPGPHPGAVVLHFLNDPNFATTRAVCFHLARNGVAALMVKMAYYGERRPAIDLNERELDLNTWRAAWSQSVQDVRCALAWLRARPEIDAERTGLLGISLGAMVGGLAAAVDADLKRAVLVLGGGNLHEVLWSAPETRKIRRALQDRGMSREDTAAVLRPIEPLRFARPVPAGTILMFSGRKDETVPPACAEALARAFAGTETVWFDTTHVGILVHLPQVLSRTVAFLTRPGDA
jgi:dienelactone hydrolase